MHLYECDTFAIYIFHCVATLPRVVVLGEDEKPKIIHFIGICNSKASY